MIRTQSLIGTSLLGKSWFRFFPRHPAMVKKICSPLVPEYNQKSPDLVVIFRSTL